MPVAAPGRSTLPQMGASITTTRSQRWVQHKLFREGCDYMAVFGDVEGFEEAGWGMCWGLSRACGLLRDI